MAIEHLDDPQPVHLALAQRGGIGSHAFAQNIAAPTATRGAECVPFAVGDANRPCAPLVPSDFCARWT
jgi:hypothetical protein